MADITKLSDYSVLLYQGLGFDNKISLLLAALYVSVACAGNYVSSILVDRLGRVKLFRKCDRMRLLLDRAANTIHLSYRLFWLSGQFDL
jgi:hypothetical protein